MDLIFLYSLIENIFFIPLFLVAVLLAIFIPGRIIIGKKINGILPGVLPQSTLSILVGMVFWILQGLIFGYLNIRFMSYVYIAFFIGIFIKSKYKFDIGLKFKRPSRYALILTGIFLLGIFGQLQQFVITGFKFREGIYAFTGTFEDAFWHTGLIEALIRRVPPIEPGISGVVVHNYHYWSNTLASELIRVFHLPLLPTQYIYLYFTASLLLGFCALSFARLFNFNKVGTLLFVYLFYFSSDIIYILSFISTGKFEFHVHPLVDGTMFLENPPRAFSFLVTFAGLFLLNSWIRKPNVRIGIITAIIFGSVIGFKVHTGLLVLSGLFILSFYLLFKKRFKDLYLPVFAVLISAAIYIPVNIGAGAVIFAPFEMSRMFVVQKNLGMSHFEMAREIYASHNNYLQQVRMDITMLVLFLVGQFGIQNLGWIPIKKVIQTLGLPFWMFLYGSSVILVIFGSLFLQPVAGADIFNTYLASNFFLTILTGVLLNNISGTKRKKLLVLVVIFIIAVTLPRWIYKSSTVKAYFTKQSPVFSKNELTAMNYLARNSPQDAIILVFNKGTWDFLYPYVSVFTQRDMYLSGRIISGRHGINTDNRQKIADTIKTSSDKAEVSILLSRNHITYLYFYGLDTMQVDPKNIGFEKIFSNQSNTIYKKIGTK